MKIHIKQKYQPAIEVDISEARAMLASGSLSDGALFRRDEMEEWSPIENIAAIPNENTNTPYPTALQVVENPDKRGNGSGTPLPFNSLSNSRLNISKFHNMNSATDSVGSIGIRRKAYLLWFLLIIAMFPIINVVAGAVPRILGEDSFVGLIILLLCSFIYIVLPISPIIPSYYRLKNIGMNPWWCLLCLIPLANLFIYVRCAILKENSANARSH
jgi:hypothetical protein